jgi:hypothetical protein
MKPFDARFVVIYTHPLGDEVYAFETRTEAQKYFDMLLIEHDMTLEDPEDQIEEVDSDWYKTHAWSQNGERLVLTHVRNQS